MDDLLTSAALVSLVIGGPIVAIIWATPWIDDLWARHAAQRDAAYRARQAPDPAPSDPDADLPATIAALEAEMARLTALARQLGGQP